MYCQHHEAPDGVGLQYSGGVGGQAVSGEVWVRGGGSVPICDERYPAVGSDTPPGRYRWLGSHHFSLRPLGIISAQHIDCELWGFSGSGFGCGDNVGWRRCVEL